MSLRSIKTYTFKNDNVDTWFQLLEMKLPEIRYPDQEEKVRDPNYCRYHRKLGHHTKSGCQRKDILQALVDAGPLKLRPQAEDGLSQHDIFPATWAIPASATMVNPIPKTEQQIINNDSHRCQE